MGVSLWHNRALALLCSTLELRQLSRPKIRSRSYPANNYSGIIPGNRVKWQVVSFLFGTFNVFFCQWTSLFALSSQILVTNQSQLSEKFVTFPSLIYIWQKKFVFFAFTYSVLYPRLFFQRVFNFLVFDIFFCAKWKQPRRFVTRKKQPFFKKH